MEQRGAGLAPAHSDSSAARGGKEAGLGAGLTGSGTACWWPLGPSSCPLCNAARSLLFPSAIAISQTLSLRTREWEAAWLGRWKGASGAPEWATIVGSVKMCDLDGHVAMGWTRGGGDWTRGAPLACASEIPWYQPHLPVPGIVRLGTALPVAIKRTPQRLDHTKQLCHLEWLGDYRHM